MGGVVAMRRSQWWWVGMALLAFALAGTPARTAPVPAPAEARGLDQVPATAPLVVYVRGVEGVRDRLLALLEAALPDVAPQAKQRLQEAWKRGLEGRKLRGLAKDGPVFLAFTEMPKPGEQPQVAVIAAVTSYQEFRDNVLKEDERKGLKDNGRGVERTTLANGESIFFVDRKGFAVVTPAEEVANALAGKQPGLDGKVSKAQAARLLRGDLGLYLSMDAV